MESKIISSVSRLTALPEGSIVETRTTTRTRTHQADEWDFVLTADEVLAEGGGNVTVIYNPETNKQEES